MEEVYSGQGTPGALYPDKHDGLPPKHRTLTFNEHFQTKNCRYVYPKGTCICRDYWFYITRMNISTNTLGENKLLQMAPWDTNPLTSIYGSATPPPPPPPPTHTHTHARVKRGRRNTKIYLLQFRTIN